ncbi:hypothetical protein D3Z50_04545 [Clostridiaceae bacterium]|nr:hypothetical protein [Clostridiaceae bacterium]
MGINIKITDSEITDQAKFMNNMSINSVSDVDVEMNNVKIRDQAEILNNMTQDQFDEFIVQIKKQVKLLDKTDIEYTTIKDMLLDIQNKNCPAKDILRQYLPDLLTGTLGGIVSNIISNIIMR